MSYLDPVRLHFAGRFQASVSTVNNDPLHFDNWRISRRSTRNAGPAVIRAAHGIRGGDGVWRLLGCRVTAAWRGDGTAAAADDPVLKCLIADSDRQVAAKLVDLDSEQQLVSEVWGLEVRICTADGATLLRGKFEPAAFMEIWDRASGGGGDVGGGTMYQSVVSALEWADVSGSPFLQELRQQAQSGLLSIKFNVDGYNLNFQSPEFTRGRIVGTIGPASADEPHHFVRGRQFMTTGLPRANFFAPIGKINFCTAVVDAAAGKITLDVGNALPTVTPGGDMADLGALTLGCNVVNADGSQTTMAIDGIPYTNAGWYERTSGVVVLPAAPPAQRSRSSDRASKPAGLATCRFRRQPGARHHRVSGRALCAGRPVCLPARCGRDGRSQGVRHQVRPAVRRCEDCVLSRSQRPAAV